MVTPLVLEMAQRWRVGLPATFLSISNPASRKRSVIHGPDVRFHVLAEVLLVDDR